MGSGNTSATNPGVTNTGLANAFMSNQPTPQTYSPAPTSYANLAAPGSIPGMTGSLIGNGNMPPLPQPAGPMPIPAPAQPTSMASFPKVFNPIFGGYGDSGRAGIGRARPSVYENNPVAQKLINNTNATMSAYRNQR